MALCARRQMAVWKKPLTSRRSTQVCRPAMWRRVISVACITRSWARRNQVFLQIFAIDVPALATSGKTHLGICLFLLSSRVPSRGLRVHPSLIYRLFRRPVKSRPWSARPLAVLACGRRKKHQAISVRGVRSLIYRQRYVCTTYTDTLRCAYHPLKNFEPSQAQCEPEPP